MIRLLFVLCVIALITFLIFGNYNRKTEGASTTGKIFFGIVWIIAFLVLTFSIHSSETLGLTIAAEIALLAIHVLFGYANINLYWKRINNESIAYIQKNIRKLENDYTNRPKDQENLNWKDWLTYKNYRPTYLNDVNKLATRGMFWLWFSFLWVLELIWDILTKTGPTINNAWKHFTKLIGKDLKTIQDKMWEDIDKDR